MKKITINAGAASITQLCRDGYAKTLHECFPSSGKHLLATSIKHTAQGLVIESPSEGELIFVPDRWAAFIEMLAARFQNDICKVNGFLASSNPIEVIQGYNRFYIEFIAAESLERIAAGQWSFRDAMQEHPDVKECPRFVAALVQHENSGTSKRKRGRAPKARRVPENAEALLEFVSYYHYGRKKPLESAIQMALTNHSHLIPKTWYGDNHQTLKKLHRRNQEHAEGPRLQAALNEIKPHATQRPTLAGRALPQKKVAG